MVCVLIGTERIFGHAHTHTDTHTLNERNNNPCVSVASHAGLHSPFSPSLSLLSLPSLSPSQVNRGHVIKRPSLCPLTLVNEKNGEQKAVLCRKHRGKKMITESDVCVFLPLCPGIDSSRAHIENRVSRQDTWSSLVRPPHAPDFIRLDKAGFRPWRN